MEFSIAPLMEMFPTYSVAVLKAEGLEVTAERGEPLAALIEAAEEAAANDYDSEKLGEIKAISDWRHAYRKFGIKQTKYRASVERLLRSAVKGRGLPEISRPVDAYNLISLKYLAPVGADDLDHVTGPLCFRLAQGYESFLPLGKADQGEDPPKAGEVIYADAQKVLCRRWNWYQDSRSCITADTTKAVVTLQSLGNVDLEAAAENLCQLWRDYCGARHVSWQKCDIQTPAVRL
jgi:DNA/RNA-binding domain of Phe-tRNA-synthetase-like protein